jgi:NAD(P)-dependent dehydrogenase (short-subunit alcohol dehydrogenase family)
MMRFEGKGVLVTGAGSGIGRETAVSFAREGAHVAANDVTASDGLETERQVSQTGSRGAYIEGDVSSDTDAQRIVTDAGVALGCLDIVVNNAGVVLPGRIDNATEEDWDRTIAVNLKGVFLISKYAVREMIRSGGGAIVNIASAVVLRGCTDRAAYTASKGGVWALTKAMAADCMRYNIRVNCLCPGTVATPSFERRVQAFDDPDQGLADFVARQPLGRLGTTEEIAAAVLFLASAEASFIQGATLAVDGAMSL